MSRLPSLFVCLIVYKICFHKQGCADISWMTSPLWLAATNNDNKTSATKSIHDTSVLNIQIHIFTLETSDKSPGEAGNNENNPVSEPLRIFQQRTHQLDFNRTSSDTISDSEKKQINTTKCPRCKRSIDNVDCHSNSHNSSCLIKETRCRRERRRTLENSANSRGYLYVPECRTDGRFEEIQCHTLTGYCWCVSQDGHPLPRTSARGKENIRCDDAPSYNRDKSNKVKKRRGLINRKCSRQEKVEFSSNLINLFREELSRQSTHHHHQQQEDLMTSTGATFTPTTTNLTSNNTSKKSNLTVLLQVIKWKFSDLDHDTDQMLNINELRALQIMVVKMVKPLHCALHFPQICDRNGDLSISSEEWTKCLQHGVKNDNKKKEVNISSQSNVKTDKTTQDRLIHHISTVTHKSRHSPNGATRRKKPNARSRDDSRGPTILEFMKRGRTSRKNVNKQDDCDVESGEQKFEDKRNKSKEWRKYGQYSGGKSRGKWRYKADIKYVGSSNCFNERQKATELNKDDPRGHIYVPNCDSITGLYTQAQCHTSTRYCWCVDPKTGMPIPGLSTYNVTPNCDELTMLARRIPGCTFQGKKKLLTELLDMTTQQMADVMNNNTLVRSSEEPDPSHSIEERAVRWRFKLLDLNSDQVLTKSELKPFSREMKKALIRQVKLLRICGRKFLHFCDADSNDIISIAEWIDCFGLKEISKISSGPTKRMGRNPFSTMLN